MVKSNSIAHGSGFKNCYLCGVKYYALSKKCLYCSDCVVDRSDYMKNYYHKVTKVKKMDKKLKTAAKDIKDRVQGSAKVVNKDFKGLLKEDKKLDKQRDDLKAKVNMKKGC